MERNRKYYLKVNVGKNGNKYLGLFVDTEYTNDKGTYHFNVVKFFTNEECNKMFGCSIERLDCNTFELVQIDTIPLDKE